MIWGITLEPGKDYSQLVQDKVQLSMATMEIRGCIGSKDEKYSHVVMRTSTAEYLLCTLVGGVTYQQGLDLKLMPNDEVTFTVQGTNTVYLTGYSYMSMEVDTEQPEDWIEDPPFEDGLSRESGDFVDEEEAYYPSAEQEQLQEENEGNTPTTVDKYTVLMEAKPDEEQQYQPDEDLPVGPSRPEESQTEVIGPSSHARPTLQQMSGPSNTARQPTQQPTGILGINIKTEVHPIAETDEPAMNQSFPERPVEVRAQPTHLPSTSTGQPLEVPLTSTHAYIGDTVFPAMTRSRNPAEYRPQENANYQMRQPPVACLPATQQWNNDPLNSFRDGRQNVAQNQPSVGQNFNNVAPPPSHGRGKRKTTNIVAATRKPFPQGTSHSQSGMVMKSFNCRFCNESFLSARAKRQHEMLHSGDRPYTCSHCMKSFRSQDSLTKHLRTHTGERPYTCDLCGKTFIQNSHLHVHLRKFHNKVSWKPKN